MPCRALLRDEHDTSSINNNTEELRLLLLASRRKVSREATVSLVSALVSGAPAIERNTVVSKRLILLAAIKRSYWIKLHGVNSSFNPRLAFFEQREPTIGTSALKKCKRISFDQF